MPHDKQHTNAPENRRPWRNDAQPTQTKGDANASGKDNKSLAGKPGFENEGEGSRTAARNYDAATERYVQSGSVEHAAKEAKQALEGDEAEELRKAEEIGREGEPAVRDSLDDTRRDVKPAKGSSKS